MVSSELKDPGLGTGWVYTLENTPFQEYLLMVTDQKEVRMNSFACESMADVATDDHLQWPCRP
jgi:hypothetical protein